MNKKIITCLLCSTLILGANCIQTKSVYAVNSLDGLQMFVDKSDEKDKGNAPVITADFAKFIVVKNSSINLDKELALKITDDKDGDLTEQVKLPEINTSKIGKQEFEISITDTDDNNTKFPIEVNVIDIKEPLYATKFADIAGMDFKNILEGNTKELSVKLKSSDEGTKKVSIEIGGNGYKPYVHELDVVLDANAGTGNTVEDALGKESPEKNNSENKKEGTETNMVNNEEKSSKDDANKNANSKTLPQTGDFKSNAKMLIPILGITIITGVSCLFINRKMKKNEK